MKKISLLNFLQLFYLFFEICIALCCFRVDGNVLKLDLFYFFSSYCVLKFNTYGGLFK